jgi:hypothetical protein
MPPTLAAGSRMHAATHDPRMVESTTLGSSETLKLALNNMDSFDWCFDSHLRAPNTASIAAFIFSIVNGFARTLFAPSAAAFCTSALSPCAVSMMNAARLVAGLLRTACNSPRPIHLGHVEIRNDQMMRLLIHNFCALLTIPSHSNLRKAELLKRISKQASDWLPGHQR